MSDAAQTISGLPPRDRMLAELLLLRGLVRPDDLVSCAETVVSGRRGPSSSLGDVLVDRGLLSAEQVRSLDSQTESIHAAVVPEPAPGSRLGEFRILREIGRGAMGIVYEAVQESLGRTVAVKVLSPAHAGSEQHVLRFLREAHAVAKVNHPGIVPIYTSGQDGPVFYFAMEFVAGRSLQEVLSAGPMPPAAAAVLVRDVALALAHAHDRGLLHRDIKPGNILIDGAGRPRVTDFGLVRGAGLASLTASAAIVGTPAYMSPEQAGGRPLDERSDVYGLGAVLYAALAGEAPFRGANGGEVLARVLTGPPSRISTRQRGLPPPLVAIVERAMERDADRRYASARAMAADLDRFLAGEPVALSSGRWRRKTVARRPFIAGVLLLAALSATALVLVGRRPTADELPPIRPRSLGAVTRLAGRQLHPSLSPDGRFLAFASRSSGNWDILLLRIGDEQPVNLTADSPQSDVEPRFSPDGLTIAFSSMRDGGGIFLTDLAGKDVRRLTTSGRDPDWSPDGTRIAYVTNSAWGPALDLSQPYEMWSVEVDSGRRRRLSSNVAAQPAWSPHGQRIAFWAPADGGGRGNSLWTMPAEGGEPVRLTEPGFRDWAPVWAPDGRSVFFTTDRGGSSGIWRIGIDESSGRPRGRPEPVSLVGPGEGLYLSVSADLRRMAFTSWVMQDTIMSVPFDPVSGTTAGLARRLLRQPQKSRFVEPSPDGAWLAFTDRDSGERLAVAGAGGESLRMLTTADARARGPRWSPDGRQLAYYSDASGQFEIWIIGADGTGPRRITHTRATTSVFPAWSPDGRTIACSEESGRSFLLDPKLDGERQRPVSLPILRDASLPFRAYSWSQDGATIAGSAGGIVLYDVAMRAYRRLTTSGEFPVWAGPGPWLVYGDSVKGMSMLRAVDSRTGVTRDLVTADAEKISAYAALSRDGRTLYYTVSSDDAQIYVMDVQ